jgi:hypothetical protein
MQRHPHNIVKLQAICQNVCMFCEKRDIKYIWMKIKIIKRREKNKIKLNYQLELKNLI